MCRVYCGISDWEESRGFGWRWERETRERTGKGGVEGVAGSSGFEVSPRCRYIGALIPSFIDFEEHHHVAYSRDNTVCKFSESFWLKKKVNTVPANRTWRVCQAKVCFLGPFRGSLWSLLQNLSFECRLYWITCSVLFSLWCVCIGILSFSLDVLFLACRWQFNIPQVMAYI